MTWDEALGYVADKLQRIKAEHGPEAVAFFSHGIGGSFLRHTLKAYGTPNMAAPSFAQCRGPRDVGFSLTFGEDVGSPERTDIAGARCLVLVGSHLGENMHNTQVQEFADALRQRREPHRGRPALLGGGSKAKHYLPIRPGTDLALLLAWMNVLVAEGLYDREYVQQHGFGFEAFAAEIAPFTPEWAYPETGLEPELIRETAREMARHRPATLVHPGRHVTWYGDDAQRSRAMALLNALLGSWGRRGGFYQPAQHGGARLPVPALPEAGARQGRQPGQALPLRDRDHHHRPARGHADGPALPDQGLDGLRHQPDVRRCRTSSETIDAIQRLDLLAVVDVVGSEMAGWADVVLPEAIYLERYDDLNVEWFREPFVALRQPVVAPPADQKPNWWIARELAAEAGPRGLLPLEGPSRSTSTRA